MPLNQDIVDKIAEYIRPNPVDYLRLAAVCKLFHKVFTSDHNWRYLDPRADKVEIASNFMKRVEKMSRNQRLELISAWTSPRGWGDPKLGTFVGVVQSEQFPHNEYIGTKNIVIGPIWPEEAVRQSDLPEITLGYLARCHRLKNCESISEIRIASNFQLIHCAAHLNANAINHIHHKWRLDRELMEAATSVGFVNCDFVPKNLRTTDKIAKNLLRHNYNCQRMSKEYNASMHSRFVELNSNFFGYADFAVRDDKKMVLKALNCDTDHLDSVSSRLRQDKEIILLAIRRRRFHTTSFEPRRYKSRADISRSIPSELWEDEMIVEEYLRANDNRVPKFKERGRGGMINDPVGTLIYDRALELDPANVFFVPERFQTKELVLKALHSKSSRLTDRKQFDPTWTPDLRKDLAADKDILEMLVDQYVGFLQTCSGIRCDYLDLCIKAVTKDARLLETFAANFKNNSAFLDQLEKHTTIHRGFLHGDWNEVNSADLYAGFEKGEITMEYARELIDELHCDNGLAKVAVAHVPGIYQFLSTEQKNSFDITWALFESRHVEDAEKLGVIMWAVSPSLFGNPNADWTVPQWAQLLRRIPLTWRGIAAEHLQMSPVLIEAAQLSPLFVSRNNDFYHHST